MTPRDYRNFIINFKDAERPRPVLSAKEAQQDVGYLIDAMESAYPAKWAMEAEDWSCLLESLRTLQFPESISREDFGTVLADILWKIPDGHLKIKMDEVILGNSFGSHRRNPTTGQNLAHLEKEEFWKLVHRPSPLGEVPVLAISGFPQASESHWNGFADAVNSVLQSPALIVDLRGNAGGDDTTAIDMTSILLGRKLSIHWVQEIICESAPAYALQANTYANIISRNYDSKNLSPPNELAEKLTFLLSRAEDLSHSPLPDSKVIRQERPIETSSDEKTAFSGNIFVLIDAHTVSSGEWTALYLKNHPSTRLIGESTYGMIHFGNSGLLQLPRSGLNVTLCMKINKLTDGRFFEKRGISPDIEVSNKDSLAFTLSNLLAISPAK